MNMMHREMKKRNFIKAGQGLLPNTKIRSVLQGCFRSFRHESRNLDGVISLSAGNHAQALSWGGAQFGISSQITMSANSLQSKVEATRNYWGEVLFADGKILLLVNRYSLLIPLFRY